MKRYIVFLLAFVAPQVVAAQETQVPLDEAGEVSVITASMEQKLNLFPNVSGFREARLFETGPSDYELIIQYQQNDEVQRERRALSVEEVRDLRRRVTKRMQETDTSGERAASGGKASGDGRSEFALSTVGLGVAEGVLLAATFDGNAAAGVLTGGAIGFFVPRLAVERPVTEAEGVMTGYGGLQGLAHGFLLLGMLPGEAGLEREAALVPILLTAGEAVGSYRLADRLGQSAGTAEMISFGSAYGAGLGLGLAVMMRGEDPGNGLLHGAPLVGTLAGSYAGYALADGRYAQGDARITAIAGGVGALIAGSLISEEALARARAALLSGSALGGLALGNEAVRGYDFTERQGTLAGLGTGLGMMLGVGLSATVGIDEEYGNTITALMALSAGAGLALTVYSFAGEAPSDDDDTASLRLNVNPIGAAASALTGTPAPAVRLHATF
jgi:hypothetical protein